MTLGTDYRSPGVPLRRHVKLEGSVLRSPEDVKEWVEATERELLDRIRHGPVVVG